MKSFLHSLALNDVAPKAVMFANGGARLTCEGSESLEDLRMLADAGVMVGTCGTCLDELGLRDSLVVGGIGAMPDSVAMMCGDSDIITIA
jgi:intracellular sulfur oxidation DsrE/DsrF family protein